MALLSNINNLFSVDSTGEIKFNDNAGTSGYVLVSAGTGAPPVWTDRDTGNVIGTGTENKVVRWNVATATGVPQTIGDGPITFSGSAATATSTFGGHVGIGVAAHGTASLNITNANQHIRLNNGSELGIITLDTDGKLDLWAHGTDETINFRTGTGSGTVTMSVVGEKVGIGTELPDSILHVNGYRLRLGDGSSDSKLWGTPATGGNFLIGQSSSTGKIKFVSNADSDLMTILNGGNVGIGTDSPGALLHVKAPDNTIGSMILGGGNNPVTAVGQINTELNFGSNDGSAVPFGGSIKTVTEFSNGAYVGMAFYTCKQGRSPTLAEAMRISYDGNVGIGTTSPSRKLVVAQSDVTEPSGIDANTSILIKNNTWSGIQMLATEATGNFITFGDNVNGFAGRIQYSHATNAMQFETVGAERMRIQSNGNVLMGTTGATNTRLKVVQSAASEWACQITHTGTSAYGLAVDTSANTGVFSLGVYTNTGTGMFVRNEGKVGIGTVSPTSKLDISDPVDRVMNASGEGQFEITGNGYTFGIAMGDTTTALYHNSGSRSLTLGTDETPRLTILGGGNVGIGTTGPAARLNVVGVGQANNPVLAIDVTNSDSFNHGLEIFDGNLTTGETVLTAIGHSGTTKLAAIFGFVRNENSLDQNLATIGFWGANNLVTVSPAGNVGIGTGTTPASTRLQVVGTGTQASFETTASYSDILFKNSATSNFLNFSGATFIVYQGGGSGSNVTFAVDSGGTAIFKADVVAYGSPSDKRLKENIKPIDSALEKVMKLKGVTFDWKDKEDILDKEGKPIKIKKWKHDVGFIAQDVQKVIPELVRENDNGMLSMRHQGIAPILLEAIKELKAEIEGLKSNKCNCNK